MSVIPRYASHIKPRVDICVKEITRYSVMQAFWNACA